MFNRTITIATRNSPLAMWQANYVKDLLQKAHPGLIVELHGMLTKGDKILGTPLSKIGGKGLFVKELEKAILERRADIAVHSIKDMPMELPHGLTLATICERDDPRDAFVSNNFSSLAELPEASVVGTSSLRRQSQIKKLHPNLNVISLRGNVGTRLSKLDGGEYDAIILAAVGLKRLNENSRIRQHIEPEIMLPAAGQGAIGIECRENDDSLIELLSPLDNKETRACIEAERAVTRKLGGSCQIPIGAYATLDNDQLTIKALVARPDGSELLSTIQKGAIENAAALGDAAAENLISQGAQTIINDCLEN